MLIADSVGDAFHPQVILQHFLNRVRGYTHFFSKVRMHSSEFPLCVRVLCSPDICSQIVPAVWKYRQEVVLDSQQAAECAGHTKLSLNSVM